MVTKQNFQELKELYGLKRGEQGARGEAIKGQKGFQPIERSEERPIGELSERELNEALKQIDEEKFDNLWQSLF